MDTLKRMKKTLAILLLVLSFAPSLFAKDTRGVAYKRMNLTPNDSLSSVWSRLSFSTNLLDWTLLAPNIGMDIDLKDPKMISGPSLFLNFKYRPKSNNYGKIDDNVNIGTNTPFSFWTGKVELRWHYRFSEVRQQRRGLVRPTLAISDWIMGDTYTESHQRKAIRSTLINHPELIKGRSYIGIYGEYADYVLKTKVDILDRKYAKAGNAYIFGLSGGFEYPLFNYNHKHFVQLDLGANIGVVYSKYDKYNVTNKVATLAGNKSTVLPMVTELRIALTYRKANISQKYWQPNSSVLVAAKAQNDIAKEWADSLLNNYSLATNVFIDVKGLKKDMSLKHPVDKRRVISEIRKQTGLDLHYSNFVAPDTLFSIKHLGDYSIGYHFDHLVDTYGDAAGEGEDVNIRFRVQVKGRNAEEELLNSLVDSINSYRKANNINRVTIYAPAIEGSSDRSVLAKAIPSDSIRALYSRIWNRNIDKSDWKGVFVRKGENNLEPIGKEGITKPGRYVIDVKFHPEVELSYANYPLESQFEVLFSGEEDAQKLYYQLQNKRITVQRAWNGTSHYSEPVTVQEILNALEKDNIKEITPEMVQIGNQSNSFDERDTVTVYLPAAYVAELTYGARDTEGLNEANTVRQNVIIPNVVEKNWPTISAKLDSNGNPIINHKAVVDAFSRQWGYQFKDYQFIDYSVDNQFTDGGNGMLLGTAKIRLHRDFGNTSQTVKYYVKLYE